MNGGQAVTTKELIVVLGDGGKEGLKRLKEAAQDCPMCILAALKQSEINSFDEKTGEPVHKGFIFYDYHKARKEAFADIEAEREEFSQGEIY